ncbi:hypothetical protein P43SY_009885 [Pythium insidiosum]|uniref:Uncharacterized protein n=1 Tax=Pythium insidiosum TaxID=114742 RepID=A0AAD5Q2Z5_PYTIN|nr:hypothetical protein P43SY_009885 [Pythium insidiosum]
MEQLHSSLLSAISQASASAAWSTDRQSNVRPHLFVTNDNEWSASSGASPVVIPSVSDWIRVPLFARSDARDDPCILRKRAVIDAICRVANAGVLPWRRHPDIWEKLVGPPSPASLGPDWDAVSCYHPTPPLPRFVIDFCNNEMTSEAVDQAVQFLTGASSDSQSFVPAEILRLAPDAPSTRVEVSLSLGSWGSPTAQFDTMLEMIQRFEDYDEESVGQVQFVITSLILGGVEVRSHQITRLQELVTRNSQRVSIRHLNLGDALVKWADDSTLTAIQQFFAALLRDDRVNPLTALVFDGKLLSLECMIALASALRYNRHLRFLSLGSKPLRSCNWFSSTVKNITRTLLSSCPALQQVRLSAATAVSPDDHDTLALLHRLDVLYLESAPFSRPLFAPDRARPLQLLTKLLSVPSCQLRYVSVPLDGPSADDWTAFSDALAANTSVEFVQIVNVSGPSVARLQSLMERERRRIVHRPATKLAFLSVVRHRQAMRPRSGHLDAGIVSNIFALAATEADVADMVAVDFVNQ